MNAIAEDVVSRLRVNFLHGYLALRKASLLTKDGSTLVVHQISAKSGPGKSTLLLHDGAREINIVSFKTFRGCPVRTEQQRFMNVLESVL